MEISVIIPVYNAVKYIEKAVDSALQFDEVKEILLVEDGCPNGSLKICEILLKKDGRIKLFQHPNGINRGAGASRNLGIERASKEFIAFLDADDFFLPNRFFKEKELFKLDSTICGVYNPIDSHFYSEKAKQQRADFIGVPIEDVLKYDRTGIKKKDIDPKDVYKGLIYLIPNFGHFSIIGLTVKTETLAQLKKPIFLETNFYEDKAFTIKLAYRSKLVMGSESPVSKRGVHEENRITTHKDNEVKHVLNKYMFFEFLKNWSEEENIKDKDVVNLIRLNYSYFQILKTKSKFSKVFILIKNNNLIFHKIYNTIHTEVFGENVFSKLLYKLLFKMSISFKLKSRKVNKYRIVN